MSNNKEIKAAIVERVNRTIKNKLFKIMSLRGTKKYIDVLQAVVDSYNNSKHRSIGMAPNEVTKSNSHIVFKNLYGTDCILNLRRQSNRVFDTPSDARIKLNTTSFDRGFTKSWTDELYSVSKVNNTERPQLHLASTSGEYMKKRFYPEEVNLITKKYDEIEKVLKQRDGMKLVKWKNKPKSQNSWIPD
ncbi:putative uncharacterized transposon-derived protein F54H12.3 [Halotydeus destructor]|nr:putative uncharacterized transposon-derived protein F54H12.3 [Halotydeus destructor]